MSLRTAILMSRRQTQPVDRTMKRNQFDEADSKGNLKGFVVSDNAPIEYDSDDSRTTDKLFLDDDSEDEDEDEVKEEEEELTNHCEQIGTITNPPIEVGRERAPSPVSSSTTTTGGSYKTATTTSQDSNIPSAIDNMPLEWNNNSNDSGTHDQIEDVEERNPPVNVTPLSDTAHANDTTKHTDHLKRLTIKEFFEWLSSGVPISNNATLKVKQDGAVYVHIQGLARSTTANSSKSQSPEIQLSTERDTVNTNQQNEAADTIIKTEEPENVGISLGNLFNSSESSSSSSSGNSENLYDRASEPDEDNIPLSELRAKAIADKRKRRGAVDGKFWKTVHEQTDNHAQDDAEEPDSKRARRFI